MSFRLLAKEIVQDVCQLEGKLHLLNAKLYLIERDIKHIQSMCGHPDAAEGCRLIIKKCEELLKGET